MSDTLKVLVWGTADLAWAAGFIDGEGCIQVSKAGRGSRVHVLRVSASQISRAPLDRLQQMFGGGVYRKATSNPRHRDQWGWEATSHTARRALVALLPYLMVKAAEARLAVLFQQSIRTRRGRAANEFDIAEKESFRLALIEAHHMEGGDANEYAA